MAQNKPRVFLDTSIFITALLSNTGGAYYILNTFQDLYDFQTNEYVLEEIEDVLQNKFANRNDLHTKLFLLLGTTEVTVNRNRPKGELGKFKKYISDKDAPILAAAIASSDYLLTLDNEFFNSDIVTLANSKKLQIMKPKEFIESSRVGRA